MAVGLLAAIVGSVTPIDDIGKMVNIGTLLAFVIVCIAVIVLRNTNPDQPRPFRTPLVPFVPIMGILFNGYMMYKLGWINWARLIIWLVIGARGLFHLRTPSQQSEQSTFAGRIAPVVLTQTVALMSLTRLYCNCTVQIDELESSMPAVKTGKTGSLVISALRARANFGKLLRRVENQRGSLVIEKRGRPRAILLSIQDYVRLAAPEPEILRIIGEKSVRKRTNAITTREIDREIKEARKQKAKR